MTSAIKLVLTAFTLVGADKTAKVVIAENPEPSAVLAAKELTNYVFKITGRPIDISRQQPAADNQQLLVLIGSLDAFPGEVPPEARTALEKSEKYEAGWTGVKSGRLYIVGKEATGDLYATYHFLEKKLGVRWFQAEVPEDPGDWYPRQKTIVIGGFTEFREPDFEIRRLDMCSAYWYVVPKAGKACATRNGYQTPTSQKFFKKNPSYPDFYDFYMPRQNLRDIEIGGGHVMFTAPCPPGRTFPEHPEYFALVNGKRVKGEQYCFTSEGLLKATIDYILERLRESNGKGSYLFGQADLSYGWCECDNCRKLDPPGTDYANGRVDISTRLYKVSARIAAAVRKEFPDADLRIWAYNNYRSLPIGVTPDRRLKVQFCDHGRCYGHTIDDPGCPRNVKMLSLMKEWLKVIPQMYTYEYFMCTPPKYICHEHTEAKDLKFYKSLGMIGWKNEGYFTGSKFVGSPETCEILQSNWQWAWTTGHLLWDVNQDVDELLADIESKYYGRAYPAMKKYHAYRRALWRNLKLCMGYPLDDPKRPALLSEPGSKVKLLNLLDEADRLAGDDKILRFRLGRDRKWLAKYWIEPNERLAEEERRAIEVPHMTGTITIDGEGDEEAWKTAAKVSEFKKTCATKTGFVPPLDERLHTEVKVLRDADNFYFLVTALEPKPGMMQMTTGYDSEAWSGDGMEFMFRPPVVDGRYHQVAVNAAGGVYDASHPGGNVNDNYAIETKGKVLADRYVIEMRIPVTKMHPFVAGDVWRILFARNRGIIDEICPNHWDHNFTVGGCGYHDITSFTPVRIR